MKHVLIIFTGEFKTKIYPLGGIFQYEHALALKTKGIKTGIIAPGLLSLRRILKKYPYKKFEFMNGIPIFRYYKQNVLPARLGFYNLFLAKEYEKIGINLFEKYVKKFGKPDLIHAHDIRFGIYVANAINNKYKIPFLTTECSSEIAENLFPRLLKKSAINILKKSKAVTACSKPFSKIFKKKLGLKNINVGTIYPVLPNDISKNFILNKKKKNFVFITVNRLDKNKNIKLIIQSFIKGFKNENAILKIIGDGPEFKNLLKITKDNNFEKKITFIKKATREEMKKELAYSDCFLSSSFHETFGVVLIEALAFGVPVISTKAEGPSEIVNNNRNGFLVNHNDQISYTKRMKEIFLKEKKFNKLKLRRNIIKRFGRNKFTESINRIYKKCLN